MLCVMDVSDMPNNVEESAVGGNSHDLELKGS